jgi:thiol-disulfide isomerase/thioredoxin
VIYLNVFMMRNLCIIVLAAFIASSCTGKSKQTKTSKKFSLPDIPVMMTDTQERANYLADHYWDNFDFNDTTLIDKPEITKRVFVDYIDILPHTANSAMISSIRHTMEQSLANPQMFTHFTNLFEKYLYDPNSPMRNEEIYIIALEYVITSPKVDEPYKIRPRFQIEQINKNRTGQIAVDFVYTLANGKHERMHHIKSDFLILFFNNPGCTACKDIQQKLELSPVISRMQKTGKLKILAMYVDNDIDAWMQHRTDIPTQWINGYDASFVIVGENLYDLRAIPNLYLLDKDKRVILKDAYPERLEEQLAYIYDSVIT